METYPLIRRSLNPGTILNILAGKISYSRGRRSYRPIRIPGTKAVKKISFRSLLPEEPAANVLETEHIGKEEFLRKLKAASLTGRGGGAFPVHKKIEAFLRADTVPRVCIINGVECDPGLVHDAWILDHHGKELGHVASLLRRHLDLDSVILAVKPSHSGIIIEGMDTVTVPDTYPAGEERNLIRTILGMEIPPHAYPSDSGILVQNVQTLVSMFNTLYIPSGENIRYLTACNLKTSEAFVVKAQEGTPVREIAKAVFPGEHVLFTGGGIMQARRAGDGDLLSDSINCIAAAEVPVFGEKDCSTCYQCNIHCPAGLDVRMISESVRNGNPESIPPSTDVSLCIRCGTCTYVCPAGIDPCSDCRSLKETRFEIHP